MIEYGIFRKSGHGLEAPIGRNHYKDREQAQSTMEAHEDWSEWLELRSRAVTTWLREEGLK